MTEKIDADAPKQLILQATTKFDFEAKAGATEGDATSVLPRFEMTAYTGSAIQQWWAKHPMVIDLGGMKIPSQNLPIRFGHDSYSGVGHTDSVSILDGHLMATGVISRETDAARDVVSSSKNGFPWQASIGASIDHMEFIKEGTSVTVNGQQFEGPINVVTKSTLGEISFVDLGADNNTRARVAAMAKDKTKDGGDVPGEGFEPIDGRDATSQVITRAKAERQRQQGIQAHVEEALSFRGADIAEIEKIAAEAYESGASVKDTELALLRATRPRAPQITRRADLPTGQVMEAALCMGMGLSDEKIAKDRDYGPDVATQAWPLRNRGLRGTIAAALEASGVRVPYGNTELFNAILDNRHIRAEGFSTINLPGILGNVANKILLDAFTLVDATYDQIAEQADFTNFHVHSIYRLDHMGEFALVPSSGELKHGNLGDTTFTSKIDTRGQILTLTRQMIVNDDLNAFRSLPAQLARKARIAAEKALYTDIMEASDVFYTTGKGNRLTGALGITELGAAEAAMLQQADAGGDPIYAMPQFILVPPALKSFATSIFMSELIQGATTSAKGQPANNPYRGRFTVLSSPFLSAPSLLGHSDTTWYMLANPLVLPAFQIAFLDGRRAPTIETRDAEFDVLGLQMRVYWDFGTAKLDYRGVVKNSAA